MDQFLKNKMAAMPIFLFHFPIELLLQTSHIPTVKLLLPTQPMHFHYIFPMEGDQIKWSCSERTFSTLLAYLLLHKNSNSLLHILKMAAIFKMVAMRQLCFSISFSSLTFFSTEKPTHILVFLNIHVGILTWNMGYFFYLCTIFACWTQIVNFISPNYARSSAFVQIKFIGSLAVRLPWALVTSCVFLFPFLHWLFLAQFQFNSI